MDEMKIGIIRKIENKNEVYLPSQVLEIIDGRIGDVLDIYVGGESIYLDTQNGDLGICTKIKIQEKNKINIPEEMLEILNLKSGDMISIYKTNSGLEIISFNNELTDDDIPKKAQSRFNDGIANIMNAIDELKKFGIKTKELENLEKEVYEISFPEE
jgi:bifunctional DNA-binding transcriptional regulator/antitoxin component of YhaV-PrlF toxin-antitoxin module